MWTWSDTEICGHRGCLSARRREEVVTVETRLLD